MLQRLLEDVRAGKVDVIVVYKVDRLTRSLADFAKLVELFDQHGVSFLSVTQQFNTTTSMGRLTLSNGSSFGSSVIARLQCWRAARWRDGTLPSWPNFEGFKINIVGASMGLAGHRTF